MSVQGLGHWSNTHFLSRSKRRFPCWPCWGSLPLLIQLPLPKVGPQAQRGMATHFSPARRQLHRTFLGCLRKASMILLFKQTFHMKSGNRGHLQVRLYRQGRAPHFPQPAPPRLSSLRSLKVLGFPFTEQRSLERKSWKGGGVSCQQMEIFNGDSQHVHIYCMHTKIQMQGESVIIISTRQMKTWRLSQVITLHSWEVEFTAKYTGLQSLHPTVCLPDGCQGMASSQ